MSGIQDITGLLHQLPSESIENALRRRSLLEFTKYTFGESPGYDVNWHHELTCDEIDNWVDGDCDRLVLTMPPRHGKSELVSRRLPAYLLGRFPDDNVIGTSYGGSLARRMNRDVQRIIDSRRYRDVFPGVVLPRSTDVKTGATGYVRTTNMFEIIGRRGSYVSAGVGGSITGMGGDWIIIDDPIKNMQDAMSQTMRDKVWEWYSSTLYTRLESDAKILLTLTRWHSDDLAGRLIEEAKNTKGGDEWKVVSLPALSTADRAEYDQRTGKDQPLWEAKKDEEALKRTRASLPGKIWSSLYQQNPTPDDGSIWKRDYIRPIKREDIPSKLRNFGNDWDLAYTSKEANSASAWVSSGQFNNNVYITSVGALWLEFPELIEHIKSFDFTHFIENKASGASAQQTLRREGIDARLVDVESDKITRTYEVTPFGAQGRIFIASDLYEYLFEDPKQGIIHLTETNNDIDLNDALTQAIKRHLGKEITDWSDLAGDETFNRERIKP